MNDQETSLSASFRTYFYVFVDKPRNGIEINFLPYSEASTEKPLDSTVADAFHRFAGEFDREAAVEVNPDRYDDLRRAFGIQELPTFGISDLNLAEENRLAPNPSKLPSRLNPFSIKERKRILESGKYLPKVERLVISRYRNPDDLYHFVRDLHIVNIDQGLIGVAQKIERKILENGGEKLLSAVTIGKKVFFR